MKIFEDFYIESTTINEEGIFINMILKPVRALEYIKADFVLDDDSWLKVAKMNKEG